MKKNQPKIPATPLTKSDNQFPVVGVGASAGGLDAFKKLLHAIPENSGMAYVLVQHLDPTHESLLPELLQRVTNIPIVEITDDIKVLPDHIYIIPSNKTLISNDGKLELGPRLAKENSLPRQFGERHLPIDLFFSSLAEVHQSHAIGVVLSGTASDGTLGLKAIKDHGGITFAQDEASAAYEGMPNSAVKAGVVDFILPPEKIPAKLLELTGIINGNGEESRSSSGPQADEDVFKQILSLLRIRKGTDFTYYKQTTIRRRVLRRVALNKNEEPAGYLKFLRENKPEQDILYQDLLISVTEFFRDKKTFDNLCETVFPNIIKNKKNGDPIRVWVAGCSTGQEAFSIAMCFKEFLGGNNEQVQIFATDISESAIKKARAGMYKKSEVEALGTQRLNEFFTKNNGGYTVNKEVRDMCVFAVHNFLKDPPFGKMDFISCRNVLIYMEPYLQKKALTTFHYGLIPKGFLLLGKSETISSVPELFAVAAKSDKLFLRKDVPGKFMHVATERSEQNLQRETADAKTDPAYAGRTDFQKTADDIMLNKHTPASVVINEASDIVHFRGKTNDYLEQPQGKPTANLFKMAKQGLAFELRNILHKAKKDKAPVTKENIPVQVNSSLHRNISVEAIPLPNIVEPHYLVIFHDNSASGDQSSVIGKKEGFTERNRSAKTKSDGKDLRIQQLEKELAQTREDIRSITEDQEAANEELQSANEELLSGSEELQSLNEELETGKEELQSTNEELTVVNQEMVSLNEQVTTERDYSKSVVETMHNPMLVLDKDIRVKAANKKFYEFFKVPEQETEGQILYDLGNRQWNIPTLRKLLQEILPQRMVVADYEVTHNFETIGGRIMLLNAREIINKSTSEKLILLTIADVTEVRNLALEKEAVEKKILQQKIEAEQMLKNISEEKQKQLQNIFHATTVAIGVLEGPEHKYILVNPVTCQILHRKKEDLLGKTVKEVFPEIEAQGTIQLYDEVYNTGKPFAISELPIQLTALNDGIVRQRYYNLSCEPLRDSEDKIYAVLVTAVDVTEEVLVRKKIEESEHRFANMIYSSPAMICILKGEDLIIEIANNAILESWGKGKDIIGKPLISVMPEIVEQGFGKLFLSVYKTGEPVYAYETPVTLIQNGKPKLLHYTFIYQAQRDLNGEIEGVAIIASEVTPQAELKKKIIESENRYRELSMSLENKVKERTAELKTANEALEEKNTELQKMNKELEAFNYVSSHDLQEPLRKIQTFAGIILEKENQNLSDSGKYYLGRMQDAAQRMRTLIHDLLAFSRLGTGERKVRNTNVNIIIEEVIKELKDTIAEKNATIEVKEMCEVKIIPFQFRQLMQNLISNALKFSKPKISPHITIESHNIKYSKANDANLLPNKDYCHITITDNGIGFEKGYSTKIFEVFQRLHAKEDYAGTGIGLAIVKKIVDNHNGIITATSEPNKGARFDIYIPD